MKLTKEERDARLNNPLNILSDTYAESRNNKSYSIVTPRTPGNKQGSKKDTDIETQAIIGALANLTSHQVVAEVFDKSKVQVTNLANARPSGYGPDVSPDEALQKKINEKLGKASDTAIEKLQMALGLISEEKLHNSKARELSGIAKDMAVIADKARPVNNENSNKPHIVFYAPRFHKEDFYDVIEVKQ